MKSYESYEVPWNFRDTYSKVSEVLQPQIQGVSTYMHRNKHRNVLTRLLNPPVNCMKLSSEPLKPPKTSLKPPGNPLKTLCNAIWSPLKPLCKLLKRFVTYRNTLKHFQTPSETPMKHPWNSPEGLLSILKPFRSLFKRSEKYRNAMKRNWKSLATFVKLTPESQKSHKTPQKRPEAETHRNVLKRPWNTHAFTTHLLATSSFFCRILCFK